MNCWMRCGVRRLILLRAPSTIISPACGRSLRPIPRGRITSGPFTALATSSFTMKLHDVQPRFSREAGMIAKIVLAFVLTAGLSEALPGQSAQESYQQALVQEEAAGNLKQAIELYLQAAKDAGKDRALAAKALIRAAASEEKLGQPEAKDFYLRVIQMYPEQREQAQIAQMRLTALLRTSPEASAAGSGSRRTDVSTVAGSLFEQYCVSCHNQNRSSAGLSLDSLSRNVAENTAVWERVLRRLRARRDPPAGMPRPD